MIISPVPLHPVINDVFTNHRRRQSLFFFLRFRGKKASIVFWSFFPEPQVFFFFFHSVRMASLFSSSSFDVEGEECFFFLFILSSILNPPKEKKGTFSISFSYLFSQWRNIYISTVSCCFFLFYQCFLLVVPLFFHPVSFLSILAKED